MSQDSRSSRPVSTASQSKATSISTAPKSSSTTVPKSSISVHTSSSQLSVKSSSHASPTSIVHTSQAFTLNHHFVSESASSIGYSASAARQSLPVKLPQSLSASAASHSTSPSSVTLSSVSVPAAKSSVTPAPSSKSASSSSSKSSTASSIIHQGGAIQNSFNSTNPTSSTNPTGSTNPTNSINSNNSSVPSSLSSPTHSSLTQTSNFGVVKTSTPENASSSQQKVSSLPTSGHSSAAVGAPTTTPGAATNVGSAATPNAFLAHKATAGGILAVAAIMLIAVVAAILMFCRRKRSSARAEKHRRWRRGISWPAGPDSDGGYDPFFVAPRTAPAPPMTELDRDTVLSRETIGSPVSASAAQPNPFDRVAPPPRIATSTVLGQRMDTPANANFGYPFRTMYPDQPLDAQTAVQAPSIHDSERSSMHRLTPSIGESSPSMYEASLPDDDADSLYTRETQASQRMAMDPFRDQVAGPLSPSGSVFNVTRKPVPPLPPRHRSRPSLTGVMTPPTSDGGHYEHPPSSYFVPNSPGNASMTAQGLGLSIAPTMSQRSEDSESNMLTPTRRTFLNIRPKRGSVGASSAGGSV